ncbi:MAG: TonB-dependent receptor plug domain-containing protein [Nitrospira sp.]|nr:TonB-dependent receptor plug domain-containing protein [Nitrospira sp.]
MWIAFPVTARAEENKNELGAPPARGIPTELLLLKEEETVSIASRYVQPASQAPSNMYVITDEDVRHSGAPDLPTVPRRVPGLEVMQITGANFDASIRVDNQLGADKFLVMVDGRSIYMTVPGSVFWKPMRSMTSVRNILWAISSAVAS